MVYIQLDRKKLGEKKEELEAKAKDILKEDAENQLVYDNNSPADNWTFDNGEITLVQTTEIGDFVLGYKLTDDQMMQIVRHMTSKAFAVKELLSLANRS